MSIYILVFFHAVDQPHLLSLSVKHFRGCWKTHNFGLTSGKIDFFLKEYLQKGHCPVKKQDKSGYNFQYFVPCRQFSPGYSDAKALALKLTPVSNLTIRLRFKTITVTWVSRISVLKKVLIGQFSDANTLISALSSY